MRRNAPPDERRAYYRNYYASNKVKMLAYYKKWREKNSDKERERARIKYLKNKKKIAEKSKIRYAEKRDVILMKGKRLYQRTRAHVLLRTRKWRLKRDFGITVEQYDAMFERQRGLCAICLTYSKRRLGVDHCHTTKRVRGLLCHSCNIAIGLLKDRPDSALRAAKYLEASNVG